MSAPRKGWKKRLAKAAGRSPAWLRAAQINKQSRTKERGTFGPASEVVRIDPATITDA